MLLGRLLVRRRRQPHENPWTEIAYRLRECRTVVTVMLVGKYDEIADPLKVCVELSTEPFLELVGLTRILGLWPDQ